jgi:hypothetical protein
MADRAVLCAPASSGTRVRDKRAGMVKIPAKAWALDEFVSELNIASASF